MSFYLQKMCSASVIYSLIVILLIKRENNILKINHVIMILIKIPQLCCDQHLKNE